MEGITNIVLLAGVGAILLGAIVMMLFRNSQRGARIWVTLLVLGIVMVVGSAVVSFASVFINASRQDQWRQTGIEAPCTILDAWDTNTTVNNSPQVGLKLEVRPTDGASFQVQTEQIVSRLQVSLFPPDKKCTARYDPNDHNLIVVTDVAD